MKHIGYRKMAVFSCFALSLGLVVSAPHQAQAVLTPISGQLMPVQVVGTPVGNAAPDKVWSYSSGVFTSATNAPVVFPSNPVSAGLYIGSQSPFGAMSFLMANWGAGNGTMYYNYSTLTAQNAPSFANLNISSDSSNSFKTPNASNIANIGFTPPADWAKVDVNGVVAYWVLVSPTPGPQYTTFPKASQIKLTDYNLKVLVKDEAGTPVTQDLQLASDSTCVSPSVPNAWNVGGGVYYFSLKTDGAWCVLGLTLPGHVKYQGSNQLTTSLHDTTSLPITMQSQTRIDVNDEVGNPISSAGVSLAGTPWKVKVGNKYFIDAESAVNTQLIVSAHGYVTEDGTSNNTTFASMSGGSPAGSSYILMATSSAPCVSAFPTGSNASCAALRRDETMTVQAKGFPVVGAIVMVYTDAGMTILADDIAQTKGVHKTTDASAITGAGGVAKFALDTGTYYYKITSAGNPDKTGAMTITTGIANSQTVDVITPASLVVSAGHSTVVASPATVVADGMQSSTITVTIKTDTDAVIPNMGVMVTASPSMSVVVSPALIMTDSNGQATFTVKSTVVGMVTLTAKGDGLTLTTKPTVQFTAVVTPVTPPGTPSSPQAPTVPMTCGFTVGSLVKLPDDGNAKTQEDSAVYYYGKDCKRHAFSNSRVFFTWFMDFKGVTVVPPSTLAGMPLGRNLGYRPGVRMVKFKTLDKVYAVGHGGALHWVKTEAVAIALYGSDWNKKIDDVEDTFFGDYAFGADVSATNDYNVTAEMNAALTINDNL